MNWILWLILWAFMGGMPWITGLVRLVKRNGESGRPGYGLMAGKIALSFLIGLILVGLNTCDAYMMWVLAFYMLAWVIVESGLNNARPGLWGGIVLMVILVISALGVGMFWGYNNAVYFNQFIKQGTGLPIQNEVPSNLLRLTTEELAVSVARQHTAQYGSAVNIVGDHITLWQNRLVWVMMISPKGSLGFNYYAEGLVIVDANNPDAKPIDINQKFTVAEGLDWFPPFVYGNEHALGYYTIGTDKVYGRVYVTPNENGEWVSVMTTYQPNTVGVRQYTGVYVISPDGAVLAHYDAGQVPKWASQVYDEQEFLEGGIQDWGAARRSNYFDFCAGGCVFWNPSNERVELTEDTRYVFDPDLGEVVALDQVHPIKDNGNLALAGVFKSTHEGIIYYDLASMNLISGDAAGHRVVSKLNKPAQGSYTTGLELLYPLQIGNQTRQVYFVPIYWTSEDQSVVRLDGLAIIDAANPDYVVVRLAGQGVGGSDLVEQTKADFKSLFGVVTPTTTGNMTMTVNIVGTPTSFIQGGNTIVVLEAKTENSTVTLWASAASLSRDEMLKLLTLKPGDTITVTVDKGYNILSVSEGES